MGSDNSQPILRNSCEFIYIMCSYQVYWLFGGEHEPIVSQLTPCAPMVYLSFIPRPLIFLACVYRSLMTLDKATIMGIIHLHAQIKCLNWMAWLQPLGVDMNWNFEVHAWGGLDLTYTLEGLDVAYILNLPNNVVVQHIFPCVLEGCNP